MLESLHIRDFVHIDSLDISFGESLVIISGPTGAGKSVIVGALSLLLGAKADAAFLSPGAQNCVVEGVFRCNDSSIEDICNENDVDYDGGNLIIRRTISSAGRSRAFINDSPVQLPVLSEIGALLVDIHSQHDTLLLTSTAFQLKLLDSYAGSESLRGECASLFAKVRELDSSISALQQKIDAARGMSDYNASLLEQLRSAAIREGELAELEQEQNTLAHQEQIKELLSACSEILDPSDAQSQGVNAALSALTRNVEKLSSIIPSFASVAARLEEARIEVGDISDEIMSADSAADASPERLQWIDDRLNLLYSLMKRHSCEDEAGLIAKRDELSSLVDGTQDLEDNLADLVREKDARNSELLDVCRRLHEKRLAAADSFSGEILKSLAFMELDQARFRVNVEDAPVSATGADSVSFLFSATNDNLVPVAKCASGGELSRIMLSLKNLMSAYMSLPTMVFDEIDTGVSGSVADKMGGVICSMGEHMQVFAITHLPQVAAKGKEHFLVRKSVEDGRTRTEMEKLSDEQRVLEIARMLSGSSLSPEAIANARALLQ